MSTTNSVIAKVMIQTISWLLSGLLLVSASHAAIKKWVDDEGVVHYGSSIPPQYVDREHSQLNKRGIEVNHVGRAKTPEELAREKELERMRRAQQQLVEEQRARDRLLLNMYRNEEDLVFERNGKLAQVDAFINSKQKQVEILKQRLANWQAMAADAERRGSELTPQQQASLESTEQQIEITYSGILDYRADRLRIEQHYTRDLNRLRQLRSLHARGTDAEFQLAIEEPDVRLIEGTFYCDTQEQCRRLWPIAVEYAKSNANTPLQVSSTRIAMTRQAAQPAEISTTVSIIRSKETELLFLDVQCHNSVSGRALCNTPEVSTIRERFRDFIQAADRTH